jgi:hypothetical protein
MTLSLPTPTSNPLSFQGWNTTGMPLETLKYSGYWAARLAWADVEESLNMESSKQKGCQEFTQQPFDLLTF